MLNKSAILVVVVFFLTACSGGVFEVKREKVSPPPESPISPTNSPPTSSVTAGFMSCAEEYQQFTKNADGLVEFTGKLKASGQVSSQEFIKVDQDAGILSARVKNACDFFIHKLITFKEYREEIDKATADYRALRNGILQKVESN